MNAMKPNTGWRSSPRGIMKARSGPAAWVLYGLIRSLFAVMQIFPIDWNLRTARAAARIWPRITRRHRTRAIEFLTESMGNTLAPAQIERIADRCLASWAMFAVETLCLPRLIRASTWHRYITLENFSEGFNAMISGRGAILVTGHFGSFELLAHLLASLGLDVVAVMRPLDNVYLNRFLVESRGIRGLTLLDKKGAAARAEQILEEGKLLCFIGDQDAGRKGVFVDFFGRPASTYKSIGLLAMVTRRPIVVGYARRCGDSAQYVVGVQRVIRPHEWEDHEDPLRWITQAYTSAIEQTARSAPEQYLWIHRRWKTQPRAARKARTVLTV